MSPEEWTTFLPVWTTVGFSGHRNLENSAAATEGVRKALAYLNANHGPLTAISSAASGGDTLFLEEVARQKLPFRLVLPFPRERFQQDFTPEEWQRVLPLLNDAFFVEELIIRGESDKEARKEALLEGGVLTVEAADVMIFLWNGKSAAGIGGTGDVLEYARRLGKPLIVIDPVSSKVTVEERFEKLLPRKEIPASWDEKNPHDAVDRCVEELRKPANPPLLLRPRFLILLIIVLQVAAAFLGMYALRGEALWNRWEVGFLLVALFLLWLRRFEHHKWIEGRLRRELCKSFLATWDLCRTSTFLPRMTLRKCKKLAHSLQIAWCLDRNASCDFHKAREDYVRNRIEEQINYFKKSWERVWWRARVLIWFAVGSLVFAVLFAFLTLGKSSFWSWVPTFSSNFWFWVHFLSVGLPIFSAALFTYVTAQEYLRRAALREDEEMISRLEGLQRRLEAVQTSASLFRLVMEAEECLLEEVAEWYSFVRFTGELH